MSTPAHPSDRADAPMTDPRHEVSQPPERSAGSMRREAVRLALVARFRAYFFAGILVTAPIAITIYLAWLLVDFVDSRVTPLIPAGFNPETYLPFAIPGLGVVIVVLALILIGAFTAGYFGRLVMSTFDSGLARMPVLRNVYGAVKQIFETVLAQKSAAFRQAVLVQYPRQGVWTIGFLTGVTQGEVQDVTGPEVINVFVPTTPNPTSGFLLFVPVSDVVPLAMSVEDALKMVISGGIITPPPPTPTLDATPATTEEKTG
jgi:uncharacterized membrane protein